MSLKTSTTAGSPSGSPSCSFSFLSVCSGIEAASVAWEPLGGKAVGFAEIEKFPSAVLAHHWPDVLNLGDMTKHNDWPASLRPDLIVGGTPCQAFSVAGLRKGLEDPSGNLTLVFLGILAQFRPRWVVWENVPGVLSDKTGAFGAFLGGLGELGYGFAYRILDAQHFGVPQRRRRVFVVANLGSWQRAGAVLFEPESLRGDHPPRREAGQGIAPTLSARTKGGGGLGTLRAREQDSHENLAVAYRTSGNCGAWETGDKTDALTTATDPFNHVLRTTAAVRRLTPRECERLQGFPDDHTLIPWRGKMGSDGPRYKALGNSMAVPVMRWIGERISQMNAKSAGTDASEKNA
ncbi:MAG: DNA cytosine methyltransferase [Verrucomicrobiota bacterium]